MGRQYIVSDKLVSFALNVIKTNTCVEDVKRALCVLLPVEFEATTDKVAYLLQINRRTVFRYRGELESIMCGEEDPRDNWGGRRNSLISMEQEASFLSDWETKALKGELIDAKTIHNALVEIVGHPFALATTYNILNRNGWRKVKPDTCHPKSDPAAREEFKKKSQNYWRPPSKRKIN